MSRFQNSHKNRGTPGKLKCPHCGWRFHRMAAGGKVPAHSWPFPARAVCPGAYQTPRNAESDHRPLWKDEVPEKGA